MDPVDGLVVFGTVTAVVVVYAIGWLPKLLARGEISVDASPASAAPSNALVSAARGLRLAVDEREGRWRANGTIDGVRVYISLHPIVIVEARLAIPKNMSLEPHDPHSFDHSSDQAERVVIGDSPFDEAVRVRGRAAWVFALFDPGTRTTLRERVQKRGVRVQDGAAVWTGDATTSAADLKDAVGAVVDVAKLLRLDPAREAEQLAANLSAETNEVVRLRIIECLARTEASPVVHAALDRALDDRSPVVRLRSALAFRSERAKAQLAVLARDRKLAEDLRIEAFDAFLDRAGTEEIALLTGDVLDANAQALTLSALQKAGDHRIAQAALLPIADSPDADIRREVVHRLDASTREGEKALLERLAADDDQDVILAALVALGRGASVSAVERLRPFTEGFLANADRRAAAAAAIEAIQERAKSAPGGLTLAEGDDPRGRLSPALAQQGAVAITTPKKKT